jgi:predicted transcriptional regulator
MRQFYCQKGRNKEINTLEPYLRLTPLRGHVNEWGNGYQSLWVYDMMNDNNPEKSSREDILRMAVDVVAAYVSKNPLPAGQIPEVIHTVFSSLSYLENGQPEVKAEAPRPAVPVKKSVTPDYIICLEDGKKLKMLKRHLRTTYNMTPDEYRAKWNLPPDYPMVAPNYAAQRSDFAKKIGLGRKAAPEAAERRGRRARPAAK